MLWSVHRGRPKILHIVLPRPGVSARQRARTLSPDSIAASCAEVDAVADRLVAFLAGEDIRFSLDIVRLDRCSAFQRRVLRADHGIPRGSVSTYQRVARHLGNAGAARAVGRALATNPFPVLIPCHRVIAAGGALGGFGGGLAMKRALLAMEGVRFDDRGRVEEARFFY
jgi:methylated-DNA-[protein]-cysteine S-methyltransferase